MVHTVSQLYTPAIQVSHVQIFPFFVSPSPVPTHSPLVSQFSPLVPPFARTFVLSIYFCRTHSNLVAPDPITQPTHSFLYSLFFSFPSSSAPSLSVHAPPVVFVLVLVFIIFFVSRRRRVFCDL